MQLSHTRKIMTNLLSSSSTTPPTTSSAAASSVTTDATRDLAAAKRFPVCEDSLLCSAVIGSQKTLKFEETGSWFIQALTEALEESGAKTDMLTVLTRVQGKIRVCDCVSALDVRQLLGFD